MPTTQIPVAEPDRRMGQDLVRRHPSMQVTRAVVCPAALVSLLTDAIPGMVPAADDVLILVGYIAYPGSQPPPPQLPAVEDPVPANEANAADGGPDRSNPDGSPEAAASLTGMDGLHGLSPVERKVALLVCQGLTNGQIARRVFLSSHTVNYHLRRIFKKLGISSRVQLAGLTRSHLAA